MTPIDLARLLVAIVVLAYAARSDVRTRKVPNKYWLAMAGAGVALWLLEPHRIFLYAVFSGVFVVVLRYSWTILNRKAKTIGGADIKAMMALLVLFPASPVPFVAFIIASGLGVVIPLALGMRKQKLMLPFMPLFLAGVLLAAVFL